MIFREYFKLEIEKLNELDRGFMKEYLIRPGFLRICNSNKYEEMKNFRRQCFKSWKLKNN